MFALLRVITDVTIAGEIIYLDSLDLSKMRQGWGKPQVNRSIRETQLSIAGQKFERGVGTHSKSVFWLNLAGETERFISRVGVDDAAGGNPSIVFKIFGDGKKLFDSGLMKLGDKPKEVDISLDGIKTLLLLVEDGGDGISFDHADWADARFIVRGKKLEPIEGPPEPKLILTPKPSAKPRINPPRVYGCRPGNPFLFRIPTSGERPISFSVVDLPASLKLDVNTGIITGTAPPRGEYTVKIVAKNRAGSDSNVLRIISGDKLALTPPMGWNHWYAHYDRVTDAIIREAADVMVSSGMADVGYQYVSIDDCWMNAERHRDPKRVGPLRDEKGNILPNKHFPDMKALTDYIHSKGLKAGIYTSPGPRTCGGFCGSYQHEEQDAKQFAEWGFDFLKYDWCSYGNIAKNDRSIEALKKPYRLMGNILKNLNRDIVFNLCQYGMGNVWEWGAEVGGNCWRTAGDLGFELDRIFEVALKNASHREFSKPGEWNDPDYIQIGYIGDARSGGEPQLCKLSPNEQYSFMSLWCLMAAPLFYSGDMSKLDEFTINILTNPEVIEIDQDPLGECARVITKSDDTFVMIKKLHNGDRAVGLFNKGEVEAPVLFQWKEDNLTGKYLARDLWRQKDLGVFENEFSANVPRRGVVLIKLSAAK
ncbi:MAG: NPCBM/NEW2 domain-containing protein [Verrucomicrobiia bacterium]